ncbi:hydantoinase/oxoprolinase family protein [Alphaproteobacteria bacterium]|jgi:N-methylhydantoinase A/oxoprolinase/acetone carboxylase beta subunit|nr:hydantoinase/oxoprolinase family protein [Alphaproteobacteria bacterium]NCF49553.1 hydantoinase/oxoprolinase family protein [Bacteroidota bacterium]
MSLRLGCDVGGTFTDFLIHNSLTGAITTLKVPTTPDAPEDGVMQGFATLAAQHPGLMTDLTAVIHGTTLVINAILERKGAPTALIATTGFPDILETRREIRYDIYDIRQQFPPPLVPRRRRKEVQERILADGSVDTPLDEDQALETLRELVVDGVKSVAVCLIHAYANPVHEQAIARLVRTHDLPLDVSLSSEVLPEIQEFERTATTAINAYVRPKVNSYLGRMEAGLVEGGYARPLFLMQSGGGVIAAPSARAAPVRLAESGPVGGALAARALAEAAGYKDAIAFDMGGTTAKTCLIAGGQMPVTRAYEVDRVHRFKKGSGTPIAVPTVDLIEIGAGGGSFASIDRLGLIRIGPESAAADPGPACYGRGGTRATVTDANVLLGYLDPADFLAGAMKLDIKAAEEAIARDVGTPLGLSALEAAAAIIEVVNENMAQAARMYVAERGGNLERAVMVAFGGGGPLHAHQVARKLGVREILIPEAAGVFSALGFLVASPAYEVARSRPMRLVNVTSEILTEIFNSLAGEADAVVSQAAPGAAITHTRIAEMRYVGQGHQLRVPLDTLDVGAIAEAFQATYRAAYGYAYDDLEPEIVTLRLAAKAEQPAAPVTTGGPASETTVTTRQAWDPAVNRMSAHAVAAFSGVSDVITGPALLSQSGATILISSGAKAVRKPGGWLAITLEEGA